MTPSQSITKQATAVMEVVDQLGRKILFRQPTALDTLRLFKVAGPLLSQNEAWLSLASVAYSVVEIDHVPVPAPSNEAQIEGILERLGDAGVDAIGMKLNQSNEFKSGAALGNSLGTPS